MSKAKSAAKKAAAAVARAYRSSLGGGSYGAAIAAKATKALEGEMVKQLGAMTLGMHAPKKKHKRSKVESAARKRVLAAHRASAARAARLPGKKKRRSKSKKVSKKKRSVAQAPVQARRPKRRTGAKQVTADSVIRAAAQAATKRWLCEGARRSGCGAAGSRVVTGSGSFKRLRPPRFMAG